MGNHIRYHTPAEMIAKEVLSHYHFPMDTLVNELPAHIFAELQLELMRKANKDSSDELSYKTEHNRR